MHAHVSQLTYPDYETAKNTSETIEFHTGLGGGTQVRYYQPRLYTINKLAKVFGIDSLKRLRLYMESMVPSPDSITRISLLPTKMTPTSKASDIKVIVYMLMKVSPSVAVVSLVVVSMPRSFLAQLLSRYVILLPNISIFQ